MNTVKLLKLFAFVGLLFVAACDGNNGVTNTNTDNEEPIFGFLAAVQDPDGRANFLHTTTELGPDVKFEPSESLELPGFSRFWAKEKTGEFFIGDGEELAISKWRITEDGEFEKGQTVSFQGEGTTWIFQRLAFASETKAYYIDMTQTQLIVFNPEEMVIDKVIPLPPEMAPEVNGLSTTTFNGEFHIVNDHLFIPVGWTDFDTQVKQSTGVAVVNINTDEVTFIEDNRAPAAFNVVRLDNDDLYFGTSWPVVYDEDMRQNNETGGILRIKAGETTFDPDFFISTPEVMADIVESPVNNKVYVRTLDQSRLKWTNVEDASETFSNVWQVALLDVTTGDFEIVETLPHVQWFSTLKADGRLFASSEENIPNEPQSNRIVRIQEAGEDGKIFTQVYKCDRCRFIQEIARLR